MPEEFENALLEIKQSAKKELLWHTRAMTLLAGIPVLFILISYYAMGVSEVRSNNEKHTLYETKFEKNEKSNEVMIEKLNELKIEIAKITEYLKIKEKK